MRRLSFECVTYERLLSSLLLLVVFLTSGLSPMQTDTWWQLRAGKDMWTSGSVLLTDQYSHTAFGGFWLNHEWLADVVFYALYRGGGLGLVTAFSAALIAAGWFCSWKLARGQGRIVFLIMLVALIPSAGWWEPRPHAFSLLFIPLTALLVSRDKLVWVPWVFLIWANCHGGVLLGLLLLVAGLVAQVLVAPRRWARSASVVVASAAAMTATPLGVHFWTEIPRSLARISLYPLNEWMRTELSDPMMLPFWGIAAGYVIIALRRLARRSWRLSPGEASIHATALVLLPGAIMAVRNVGPFLMVAVPAMTHLLALPTPQMREGATNRAKALFNLGVIVACSIAAFFTLIAAYSNEWSRLKWSPMPRGAISALEGCQDNLYNRYDEGGMLLWFTPRRVFLDGRQDPFPSALVLEHVQMETGRLDYRETFDRHNIRCAFLPTVSPVASQLELDGWSSLYRDERWLVLVPQGQS